MRTLNVSEEGYNKLLKIKADRPQDGGRADTFDYILRVYEESPLRIERGINPIPAKHAPGSVSQPAIINSEELQNKAYMDSKRSIADRIRKGENKE